MVCSVTELLLLLVSRDIEILPAAFPFIPEITSYFRMGFENEALFTVLKCTQEKSKYNLFSRQCLPFVHLMCLSIQILIPNGVSAQDFHVLRTSLSISRCHRFSVSVSVRFFRRLYGLRRTVSPPGAIVHQSTTSTASDRNIKNEFQRSAYCSTMDAHILCRCDSSNQIK